MFCIKKTIAMVCLLMGILNACTKKSESPLKEVKTMNHNEHNRPQEPKQPYPYHEEEVTFKNTTANITLAGTLTMPRGHGPFLAVLLISGMGPNERDYAMMGHKLFLVLADHLTRHGIAVLRYDKRGVGKSTGTFDTTITSKNFAEDALAGINYLTTRKEINAKHIGVIGHSEGGLIASMVAAQSPEIAFVVLMAPAIAMSIDDIIEHVALQLRADGASKELIALDGPMRRQMLNIAINEPDYAQAAQQMHTVIAQYLKALPEEIEAEKFHFAIAKSNAEAVISLFNSPWYRYLLASNPITLLKQIAVPVLAINGSHDFITT